MLCFSHQDFKSLILKARAFTIRDNSALLPSRASSASFSPCSMTREGNCCIIAFWCRLNTYQKIVWAVNPCPHPLLPFQVEKLRENLYQDFTDASVPSSVLRSAGHTCLTVITKQDTKEVKYKKERRDASLAAVTRNWWTPGRCFSSCPSKNSAPPLDRLQPAEGKSWFRLFPKIN